MSELEITRNDVGGRARVWKMAPNDPKAAAIAAHRIRHPWYRCQALTRAAEFSNGPRRSALLDSALEAAREQDEPNRIVTVSSWPIRVLAGFSPERTAELIVDLVKIAESEPHNLRRAHALRMLALSISGRPELLRLMVPAMVETVLGGGGYRMDRVIRDIFELVRASNPELLEALALHHKPGAQRNKLLASVSKTSP